MPTFLHTAHAMDRCKCDCCGLIFPKALIHEHHVVKRASGGKDTVQNIIRLDGNCHNAVHQVEAALKNPKRVSATDLVTALFPGSPIIQKKCLELAAIAALGEKPTDVTPDYSQYDTEDLVHLTPPKVTPRVKDLVRRLSLELKNPKTGKALGVSGYLRGLVEADLKRRGLKL